MPLRSILATLILAPGIAAADVPTVATDIAPVHSLAARVMAGVGEPALVIRLGASPHGYAMRPSEATALQDADLFVWVGAGLTPWLEGPVDTLVQGTSLQLLAVEGTNLIPYADDDDHDETDHAHDGRVDPHAWLDPENGKLWLDAIADALAGLDPEHAAAYRANASAGRGEIDAAADDADAILAPQRDAPFAAYHDAYRYFARHFGLPDAVTIATSDAVSPSAARVADVARRLERSGARCVFAEPQFGTGVIRTVTEGTGAKTAILDPLGGDLAPGPDMYAGLIRDLAGTIAHCGD